MKILIVCLALGACSTLVTPSQHLAAGKALIDATDSLSTVAQAADAAAVGGYLKGDAAATASKDLKLAQSSLNAATSAYQVSEDGTVQADVAAVIGLAADITVIVNQARGQ